MLVNSGIIFKKLGSRKETLNLSSFAKPVTVTIDTWKALNKKEIGKIWGNDFSGNAIKQHSTGSAN